MSTERRHLVYWTNADHSVVYFRLSSTTGSEPLKGRMVSEVVAVIAERLNADSFERLADRALFLAEVQRKVEDELNRLRSHPNFPNQAGLSTIYAVALRNVALGYDDMKGGIAHSLMKL